MKKVKENIKCPIVGCKKYFSTEIKWWKHMRKDHKIRNADMFWSGK